MPQTKRNRRQLVAPENVQPTQLSINYSKKTKHVKQKNQSHPDACFEDSVQHATQVLSRSQKYALLLAHLWKCFFPISPTPHLAAHPRERNSIEMDRFAIRKLISAKRRKVVKVIASTPFQRTFIVSFDAHKRSNPSMELKNTPTTPIKTLREKERL